MRAKTASIGVLELERPAGGMGKVVEGWEAPRKR